MPRRGRMHAEGEEKMKLNKIRTLQADAGDARSETGAISDIYAERGN